MCSVDFNGNLLDTIPTQDIRTNFVRDEVTNSNIGIQNGNRALVNYIKARLASYDNQEIVNCAYADPADWSGKPVLDPTVNPGLTNQVLSADLLAAIIDLQAQADAGILTLDDLLAAVTDLISDSVRRLQDDPDTLPLPSSNSADTVEAFINYLELACAPLDADEDGDFTSAELNSNAIYRIFGPLAISDYVEPVDPNNGVTNKITSAGVTEILNAQASPAAAADLLTAFSTEFVSNLGNT